MNNDSILKNKKVLWALSFAVSIVIWLVVSTVLRPTGETTVSGVGVNINVQSGILGQMGLSAIEGGEATVDVVISGRRSVIGGVTAEDISVSPSLSGVSGAGKYSLELTARNTSGKDFEIVSVSPSTMAVKFDKYVEKTLSLSYIVTGDYSVPDDYVQEPIYTDPGEITVVGPEKDLEYIAGAKVSVALSGEYNETIAVTGDIVLVNRDGTAVDYNHDEISISQSRATVYIPIYQTTTIPFAFEYTNMPQGFDSATLKYTLSQNMAFVEGEKNVLSKYGSLFLGYVDLRELTLSNSSFEFDVSFPNGMTGIDNLDSVRLDFDLDGYEEATFNVKQINIVNVPVGYRANANAGKIAVKLIGPKKIIEALSSGDIVAQIDMSTREITQTGQYKMQADIILPEGSAAWAVGSYSVTVTVKNQ